MNDWLNSVEWKMLGNAPLSISEILDGGAYRILYDRYYHKEPEAGQQIFLGTGEWLTDPNILMTGQFTGYTDIT